MQLLCCCREGSWNYREVIIQRPENQGVPIFSLSRELVTLTLLFNLYYPSFNGYLSL